MREADELNSGSFCSAIIKPDPVRKREKQTKKIKNKACRKESFRRNLTQM